MTNDLAIMLIGPLTAVVGALLLGSFVMWRIHRHGQVFNWPPVPHHPKQPTRNKTEP